jgi:hypothetical protein
MGVPVESVAVGKCYLTEIGQVRRVLEIKEARVKYESRGKTANGRSWGALTTVSILGFARDVEREVPCEYDPRNPARAADPID